MKQVQNYGYRGLSLPRVAVKVNKPNSDAGIPFQDKSSSICSGPKITSYYNQPKTLSQSGESMYDDDLCEMISANQTDQNEVNNENPRNLGSSKRTVTTTSGSIHGSPFLLADRNGKPFFSNAENNLNSASVDTKNCIFKDLKQVLERKLEVPVELTYEQYRDFLSVNKHQHQQIKPPKSILSPSRSISIGNVGSSRRTLSKEEQKKTVNFTQNIVVITYYKSD